uniref:ATPase subunit 8 n=1 Tax=Valleriola javanica TaxID=236433 RepID=A0A8T9ZW12_9HEMI|nr:ATPase subunit 8 [Valleriola javanica]
MPQMAPMWWTTMFILFTMLFMMTNTIMYFQKQYSIPSKEEKQNKMETMNWKW